MKDKKMNTFEKNMTDIYGTQGTDWLNKLPSIIDAMAEQYNLTDLKAAPNLSFNYVAAGFQVKIPIILKLGFDHQALAKEALCLQANAGHGVPTILASADGIILMQRAIPAATLKDYFHLEMSRR